MKRFLLITWSSFKMAMQELRTNKLRTFLSLLGITFGIFSIISVLATISSMQKAITDDLNAIGSRVIFVQKFENSTDSYYPWWKFVNRPEAKFSEMQLLRRSLPIIDQMTFMISTQSRIEAEGSVLSGINYYGVAEEFENIQSFEVDNGRYFQASEVSRGTNVIVIGHTIAEELFGNPENALNKMVKLKDNKSARIIGVIKKQGASMIDAWEYDNSMIIPYGFMRQMVEEEYSQPMIMVKAGDNVSVEMLREELRGAMRSIRKLKPSQDDNFALNDIAFFSKFLEPVFAGLNLGGWAIAALSLFVGMFGVANIMFVTVRERTSQIGLKKAIGARRTHILTEFLLESVFLCIIGGLLGLVAVFILAAIFTAAIGFTVFVPVHIIILAVAICVVIGILAGIIPAMKASKLDPVVAIRSN